MYRDSQEMIFEAGEYGGTEVVNGAVIVSKRMSTAHIEADGLVCVVFLSAAQSVLAYASKKAGFSSSKEVFPNFKESNVCIVREFGYLKIKHNYH